MTNDFLGLSMTLADCMLMYERPWVQFSGLGGCGGLSEERKQEQEYFR